MDSSTNLHEWFLLVQNYSLNRNSSVQSRTIEPAKIPSPNPSQGEINFSLPLMGGSKGGCYIFVRSNVARDE